MLRQWWRKPGPFALLAVHRCGRPFAVIKGLNTSNQVRHRGDPITPVSPGSRPRWSAVHGAHRHPGTAEKQSAPAVHTAFCRYSSHSRCAPRPSQRMLPLSLSTAPRADDPFSPLRLARPAARVPLRGAPGRMSRRFVSRLVFLTLASRALADPAASPALPRPLGAVLPSVLPSGCAFGLALAFPGFSSRETRLRSFVQPRPGPASRP